MRLSVVLGEGGPVDYTLVSRRCVLIEPNASGAEPLTSWNLPENTTRTRDTIVLCSAVAFNYLWTRGRGKTGATTESAICSRTVNERWDNGPWRRRHASERNAGETAEHQAARMPWRSAPPAYLIFNTEGRLERSAWKVRDGPADHVGHGAHVCRRPEDRDSM